MAESIRDKVAIIGMGLSKWGERWDAGIFDLITRSLQRSVC
jgi:acetyl-CoA C-acetyltransferase